MSDCCQPDCGVGATPPCGQPWAAGAGTGGGACHGCGGGGTIECADGRVDTADAANMRTSGDGVAPGCVPDNLPSSLDNLSWPSYLSAIFS